jgi:hypothetical protein
MAKKKEFHKADEFNQFDWSKLEYGEFKTNGENYNFGKGGIHYVNGCGWQITVYSGEHDLETETWELPKAISDMLDHQAEYAEKETRRKIKNEFQKILGI